MFTDCFITLLFIFLCVTKSCEGKPDCFIGCVMFSITDNEFQWLTIPPQHLHWCILSCWETPVQIRLLLRSPQKYVKSCCKQAFASHPLLKKKMFIFVCQNISLPLQYSISVVFIYTFPQMHIMWSLHDFYVCDRVIWGGWREDRWSDLSRMQHSPSLSAPWINQCTQTLLSRQNLGTTSLW